MLMPMFSPGVEIKATITNVDNDFSTSSLTEYTFNVSFGAEPSAGEKRSILVCYGAVRNGACSFTSGTIAGNAATPIASLVAEESTLDAPIGIIGVDLASGTSGNVVLNFSGAPAAIAITVHRMINGSLTPFVTPVTADGGSSLNLSHSVPKNGVSLACALNRDGSQNTWSGMTEAYDFEYNGTSSDEWFTAATIEHAASSSLSVSVSSGVDPVPYGGCAVSFAGSLT